MKNKSNMNMLMTQIASMLFMQFIFLSFAQAQEAHTSAWLRIFPKHVHGIYIKAEDYQANKPIKLASVLVALNDEQEGVLPCAKNQSC